MRWSFGVLTAAIQYVLRSWIFTSVDRGDRGVLSRFVFIWVCWVVQSLLLMTARIVSASHALLVGWGVVLYEMGFEERSQLERAIIFATDRHSGQVDKAGEPYICHSLRVMDEMDHRLEKQVAVLHDVVEDTDATIEEIENHFGRTVSKNVEMLTNERDEYMQYVDELSIYPVARKVKMADLKDNMDLSRLDNIDQDDLERRNRYERALYMLQTAHAVL